MPFRQLLCCQRWPEVGVLAAHQGQDLLSQILRKGIVGTPPATAGHQALGTLAPKPRQQPFDLAHTDSQSCRRFLLQDAPFRHLLHHPHPIYLFATHRQIPLHPHAPFHAKGTF